MAKRTCLSSLWGTAGTLSGVSAAIGLSRLCCTVHCYSRYAVRWNKDSADHFVYGHVVSDGSEIRCKFPESEKDLGPWELRDGLDHTSQVGAGDGPPRTGPIGRGRSKLTRPTCWQRRKRGAWSGDGNQGDRCHCLWKSMSQRASVGYA
jgi:hypothetical protein